MKKIFCSVLFCFLLCLVFNSSALAVSESEQIQNDIDIQKHINDIGFRLLNANKIDVRIVFVYDGKKGLNIEPELLKRQIIVYDKFIQFAADDNEVAAMLARGICKTAESYSGIFKGFLSSIQVKGAPKKYEILFDKRAVDFMVTAGYNPVAFITFLNKAYPQKRYDRFARQNLTSKRLANIYEYIYTKYPQFLAENEYIENESYQNFLLTSIENRKKFQDKVKSGSKANVKYE